jgi:dephospho-CoA kinase
MKWIGLTGGIATGKSTVQKLIESLGVACIDADLISHQLTEVNHIGYHQVVNLFGSEILNSDLTLNRKKIAEIVFNNLENKKKLENVLHPLIQDEVQKQKTNYEILKHPICIYNVPLLFENHLKDQFDKIVLIWCDPETQLKRLQNRNQLSLKEAQMRIDSQLPLSIKASQSNFCIDNSTDLNDLKIQVENLFKTLTNI